LAITVSLWVTESLHHMAPAVPAILAVVLLSMPRIGVTRWETTTKISLDTVFILGIMQPCRMCWYRRADINEVIFKIGDDEHDN
jgi:hypothetical protein